MPDNSVQAIIALQPETRQYACPVLLDANAVDDFLAWLKVNTDFEVRLREAHAYRITVLSNHLRQRHDWRKPDRTGLKDQLARLNIQRDGYNIAPHRAFINEVQRAYFGNDSNAQESAELLTYGRHKSSDGRPVRIISRHSGFRSVPHTDLYVFNLDEVGIENDAILLREFVSLNLHKHIFEASYSYVRDKDYPTAILHAVNAFYTYMRNISGLTEDGRALIEQAIFANTPVIMLNKRVSDTERKEQRGYAEFGFGVTDVLRNVLSHHLADHEFLHDRFGDRHTALKFLCLLSLLFEKLDKRVAP